MAERWSYKCAPAPRRARRGKGHKTAADALVAAFDAVLAEHAAEGWEYLRCDLIPMETKRGLFGGREETHQGVMVFRRPAAPAARPEPAFAPARRGRLFHEEDEPDGQDDIPRLGAARTE